MDNKTITKVAGVTSIVATVLGIIYLVKNNKNTTPTPTPIIDNEGTIQIGHSVKAIANQTVVTKAEFENQRWQNTNEHRLNVDANDTIGKVIAIVQDAYIPGDYYAVIDIPVYVGPAFKTGHGFIKTTKIKAL